MAVLVVVVHVPTVRAVLGVFLGILLERAVHASVSVVWHGLGIQTALLTHDHEVVVVAWSGTERGG